MMHDAMETLGAGGNEKQSVSHSLPRERSASVSPEKEPLPSAMSAGALATECVREISKYGPGEPSTDACSVELLRRAILDGDQDAWACLQQCLSGLVRIWLHCHPIREATRLLDSEENYVAQSFERFWQATARMQKIEFSTLGAALRYLRAGLNGALLDTLRAYSRAREVSLPEPGDPREPLVEDAPPDAEVREALQGMLPDPREQRLAYLFFHCGLKPREIVRCCPQEFGDVHEIYRLRRNIMERLLRRAEQFRWRLGSVREARKTERKGREGEE